MMRTWTAEQIEARCKWLGFTSTTPGFTEWLADEMNKERAFGFNLAQAIGYKSRFQAIGGE